MNDSESPDARPDFGPEETHADLQSQFDGMRKLFTAALAALLIMGISLNVFLLRQTAFVRRDLQNARPKVTQLTVNFEKGEEPQITKFVNALIVFSRSHPDFKPILAKYKIATDAPSAPATNAGSPPSNKK